MNPPTAYFLDRDGVLIENVHTYVRRWEEVEVFDQAVEACRLITERGVPIFVVTNQAGVGRGILGLEEVEALNRRILGVFEAQGARFTGAYLCPHHPDDGCDCRKPLPGMLLRGAREHGVDLSGAVMVGDAETDLQAGEAAGCTGILVRTGRGAAQETTMLQKGQEGFLVYDDLLSAVRATLGEA